MKVTAKEQRAALLMKVAAMEKKILTADDAEIQDMADSIETEEKVPAAEIAEPVADPAADGQNARANANWPAKARKEVAARLLKLASILIADDAEDDEKEEKAEEKKDEKAEAKA